jgi:hypothetical protein
VVYPPFSFAESAIASRAKPLVSAGFPSDHFAPEGGAGRQAAFCVAGSGQTELQVNQPGFRQTAG